MAALHRSRQSNFTVSDPAPEGQVTALAYEDLVNEDIWGPKIAAQLTEWMSENPKVEGHVDGRDGSTRQRIMDDKASRPRQRFRGGWVAESKAERRKQQGGKWKGKWGKKLKAEDGKNEEVRADP